MTFKNLGIEDLPTFEKYLNGCKGMGSEFSFVTNFIWQKGYDIEYAETDGFLVIKGAANGVRHYGSPIGKGDKAAVFKKIAKLSRERGEKCIFINLSLSDTEVLQNEVGNFEISCPDSSADYIYLTEKLISLSGKKLHAKRNHYNRFVKENDFSFCEITNENVDSAYQFILRNSLEQAGKEMTEVLFSKYFDLPVKGAVIEIGGKIVAATIGEKLQSNTALIHIEKGEKEINGVYAAINKLFLENLFPDTVYVNREDDMGIEGLRRAKQSYHPEMMLKKYRAEEK